MLESVMGNIPATFDNCTDDELNDQHVLSIHDLRKGEPMYNLFPLIDYIDHWLETFKRDSVKPSTYDRLLTSRKALEKYPIARMSIGGITLEHIQIYVNTLTDQGYALTTIKKQARIVTAPLKHAAAMHHIPIDPTYGIKYPARTNVKKESRDVVAYTEAEQKVLSARFDTYAHPAYAVAALMMETGLRIGEALSLRWSEVEIFRKRLHVRATVVRLANKKQSVVQDDPKTHSSKRTIPLSPKAIQILERMQQDKQNEWVFNNTDGERLSYEAVRYQLQRICKRTGIAFHGTHVFRHTFATNCYHKGMDVKILSKFLGHSDVNITYNTYIHLYGDGFDEMYSALVQNA